MTDATKPSWIVRIPTPIWLVGLIGLALLIDWPFQFPAIVQHRLTGAALIIVGIALSAWARLTFSRRSAEIFPWSDTHSALVTGGPFRFSRNPMYLGLVVIGVGTALVAGTWLRDHSVRGAELGAHVRRGVPRLPGSRAAVDLNRSGSNVRSRLLFARPFKPMGVLGAGCEFLR